ncbi:hypothetical protein [Paenibacillus foliorum]|uniref:hypothetical protein n=1 Tax=Paenibacillus foliorum TaxID=2654974 RepID=UPI00149241FA|nr:hypothetical protein [Paenibacillus foliorum]
MSAIGIGSFADREPVRIRRQESGETVCCLSDTNKYNYSMMNPLRDGLRLFDYTL